MIPLDSKARDGAQQVGLRAVARKMLDRLGDEKPRLLPCAVGPKHRDERRLAGMRVLAGRLAGRRLGPAMVDQVVRDLERETDVAGIAAVRRPSLARKLGHDARRL